MIVTSDHSNSYMRNETVLGAGDLPEQVGGADGGAYAYPDGEVTYGTGNHTNELVTLSRARGRRRPVRPVRRHLVSGHADRRQHARSTTPCSGRPTRRASSHVILFIGDGMNIEHEIAGSRYLYGEDIGSGLARLGPAARRLGRVLLDLGRHDLQQVRRACSASRRLQRRRLRSAGRLRSRPGRHRPLPAGQDGQHDQLHDQRLEQYFLPGSGGGYGSGPATDSASAATAMATGLQDRRRQHRLAAGRPGHGGPRRRRSDDDRRNAAGGRRLRHRRGQHGAVQPCHARPPSSATTSAATTTRRSPRRSSTRCKPEVVIGGGHRGWGGNYLSAADQTALENGATAYTYVGRQAGTTAATRC